MASNLNTSNLERAQAAWGDAMPAWVRLLATTCDMSNQRSASDRLNLSSGTISKVVNRKYPGSYEEMERKVRATFGGEDVNCPLFGPIPLTSCMRARRRKGPPRNQLHHQYAAACPDCTNNSDGGDA